MPTPLTDADKVLRNDTGIDIATNIASIASALTPSNITDLGDVQITNPINEGQVIKYDTTLQKWVNGLGNVAIECTTAQYNAWKQTGQLKTTTSYILTDAPNLNATAEDISYDGSAVTVKDKVDDINSRLGSRLVGAWTADSSTGNVQILTDDIDVTAGTYLIIMTYPDTSSNFVASLYNRTTSGVYDNCYMSGGSWTSRAIITAFSGNGKMCIASAQGATCNFTNKNRGSIRAIKLSDNY